MKIEIYDETYAGTVYLCTRVLRGNTVRYGGRCWLVRRTADGQFWTLGHEVF